MQQELVTLPEHLSSPPVVIVVRVAQSLVFCSVCFFAYHNLPFCVFFSFDHGIALRWCTCTACYCSFVYIFLLTMVLPFFDVHARLVIGLLWFFFFWPWYCPSLMYMHGFLLLFWYLQFFLDNALNDSVVRIIHTNLCDFKMGTVDGCQNWTQRCVAPPSHVSVELSSRSFGGGEGGVRQAW